MYKIPATTLFLGKNLIFVPECHSTNDLALQLCQKPFTPEGSVVITTNQTAGRGQRGNMWEAEPGKNLTLSIILKPSFLAVNDQFYLNIFASLGIRDYLTENTSAKVHVKWPNDILINEKKVAGILIENQITGNQLSNSVIGIGLNINQRQFSTGMATALSLITGREHDLQSCFEELLVKLEVRLLQLRQGNLSSLKDEYLSALYRYKEPHTFYTEEGLVDGTVTGIDATGRLEVLIDNTIKYFTLKEIRF